MNKNDSFENPQKLTKEHLENINSFDDLLDFSFGKKGTQTRNEFDAKIEAFLLAEKLKDLRNQAKLSQQALADKIGLKKSFISRIENGKVDVQLSTLLKILNGLNRSFQIV